MVPGFHWLTRTEAEEELADFFYTIWYKKKKKHRGETEVE